MNIDNKIKQAEEVEVLAAIYGEDWITESENSYNIKIVENSLEVILYVTMTPGYPAESSPKYELSAPWMDRKVKAKLYTDLEEVYQQNLGESIIYQWVEKIREVLQNMGTPKTVDAINKVVEKINISKVTLNCPEITHGQVITDRKSTFQGHAARVHSVEDVNTVLDKLKENKKILNATHNMYAYRIEKNTKSGVTMVQDCDDDGESHAGSRMLHLLQILEQRNVVVVVSRWYGGIQLGPDRFRHINNATRQVLDEAGFLTKK
ncbi:hypothetical protein ACJJTC_001920 [Scirpophaga incertulas]